MTMKKKGIWLAIIALIALEQGIKIVINKNFLESNTPILAPWLFFNPKFNRDYSWINSMLQLGIGKWIHILVVIVIIIVAFMIYRSMNKRRTTTLFIDITFSFLIAGAMCSLIDKVFWDGSLDYIHLVGFFIFDLKDIYINVFNGLLILMVLIDYEGSRKGRWGGDED